jgi:hypothetical protein
MRTLTVDNHVLTSAKGLAVRQNKTIGKVISALARQALLLPAAPGRKTRNGVPLLNVRPDAMPVALERVTELRDESP